MDREDTVLLLPGLGNSGPEHWQSVWERQDPACVRIVQEEWDRPRCADWVLRLDEAVLKRGGDLLLVGHSSACALVAHWAERAEAEQLRKVRGALLVAPSDPEGPHYPPESTGFAPVPLAPLPFPSTVVASDDDPYITVERAREYATAWGSRYVLFAGLGHINSASGVGGWSEGWALLQELRGVAPLSSEPA